MDQSGNDGTQEEAHEEDDGTLGAFKCFICWDWLYKPVVLPCGHVFCFWCIQQSMNDWNRYSHCALCRQTYTHVPDVCKLLHSIILKVAPPHILSKREHEIHDFESQKKMFSTPIHQREMSIKSQENASCPSTSSTNTSEAQSICKLAPEVFSCASCKELLNRPIVLNCGEVFCEHCIKKVGTITGCPSCNIIQPTQSFNVCWSLHEYMLQLYPEIYLKKTTEIIGENADQITPNRASVNTEEDTYDLALAHYLVGCDQCGMFPIIGDRYRCQDCPESFDLCGICYERGVNTCGRFNQQHVATHCMEKIPPSIASENSINVN